MDALFNSWLIINLGLVNSCKKTDLIQTADFYFVNQTNYIVTIENHADLFTVKPGTTFYLQQVQPANKKVDSTTFSEPVRNILGPRDRIVVKFDNLKCLPMLVETENSLLNLNNYFTSKISERTYKFTYTFTEADYQRAVACP